MTGMETGIILLFGGMGFAGVWYLLGMFATKVPRVQTDRPKGEDIRFRGDSVDNWYEVLDVSPTADWSKIKASYLNKISRYHPDKFASLDAEFNELASSRAKIINDAFETAKALRYRRPASGDND